MLLKFQRYDVVHSEETSNSEGENENGRHMLEHFNKKKRSNFRNHLESSLKEYKTHPLSQIDAKLMKGVIHKKY